jgi:hypothetical protein
VHEEATGLLAMRPQVDRAESRRGADRDMSGKGEVKAGQRRALLVKSWLEKEASILFFFT